MSSQSLLFRKVPRIPNCLLIFDISSIPSLLIPQRTSPLYTHIRQTSYLIIDNPP
ncbi:unnamed protein product [Meloidogyne enterolobii]|uniref:Uncharacterized protein n=1 Tax=Meloidogyne enterolobii TaxID=390850 RepID=A0ACB0ZFQ2_MELEN